MDSIPINVINAVLLGASLASFALGAIVNSRSIIFLLQVVCIVVFGIFNIGSILQSEYLITTEQRFLMYINSILLAGTFIASCALLKGEN